MLTSIIADYDSGGNFLAWSLYFLNGSKEIYDVNKNIISTLPTSPLNSIQQNAHGFAGSHVTSFEQLKFAIEIFKNRNANFNVAYHHDMPMDKSEQRFDLDLIKNSSRLAIDLSIKNSEKIILLHNSHPLYYVKLSARDKVTDSIDTSFYKTFFAESLSRFNLGNVWEGREFLALNIRPYNNESILSKIKNLNNNCFILNSYDLINTFDKTVFSILKFLNITPDAELYNNWVKIYNQWKTFHYNRSRFSWYLDSIVYSIINNVYADLTSFDLDLMQEATILHELIFKHNLTIKADQVAKFLNTCQLHNLLEPNIYHNIDDIYGVLNK